MSRTVKAPDERRQELLGIGLNLFMQKGGTGVSIKEVVQQANVATGLFYYYFTSKDTFLEEAINTYITGVIGNMVQDLQNERTPILQRVKNVLIVFCEHANRFAPFMQEDVSTSSQHHVLMDSILKRLYPIVQEVIEQGNCQGVFHVDNPTVTAAFIIHGLSGVLHTKLPQGKEDNCIKDIQKMMFTILGVSQDYFSMEVGLDGKN